MFRPGNMLLTKVCLFEIIIGKCDLALLSIVYIHINIHIYTVYNSFAKKIYMCKDINSAYNI